MGREALAFSNQILTYKKISSIIFNTPAAEREEVVMKTVVVVILARRVPASGWFRSRTKAHNVRRVFRYTYDTSPYGNMMPVQGQQINLFATKFQVDKPSTRLMAEVSQVNLLGQSIVEIVTWKSFHSWDHPKRDAQHMETFVVRLVQHDYIEQNE